ncbi:Uncharacterised protein [Mycobacteroides abscessus subsp. abscessus]|nr:Uncharacterised protein [Mycobacteroides abscessus subsp. abscessus]
MGAASADGELDDLAAAAHALLAAATVDEQRPIEVSQLPTIDTLKDWGSPKVTYPLVRGYFTTK